MIFVNLSTNKIVVFAGGEQFFCEHKNVETHFPTLLLQIYQKYGFSRAVVLNGPGGFTHLRVGCLALNSLGFLYPGKIKFFSVSKLDFFRTFFKADFLPSQGLIYLGQKRQWWLYDFTASTYQTVVFDNLDLQDIDCFIDEIYETDYQKMLHLGFENDQLVCSFGNQIKKLALDQFSAHFADEIFPDYMIEPTVTLKQ
ncbi:MAG TPA: hypothetical protein PKD96_01070 [Candidatus Absconditabacterales bacterium]|nr:hypothetical protein [Candidatus Absconditabacterales bacterium]HMT26871.1 hypothetical protein [Candidatus Absconditabacterales bacterium]